MRAGSPRTVQLAVVVQAGGPALTQLAIVVQAGGPALTQLAVAVRVGRPGPGQLTQLTMPVVQGLKVCYTISTTTYELYTYMYAKVGFNTIMYYIHTKESGSQPAIVSTYVRIDLSVP